MVFDWIYQHFSTLIGYGHSEFVKVIADHAQHLHHQFNGMLSYSVIKLAKRLVSVAPAWLDKVFFLSMGGESMLPWVHSR